MNWKLPVYLNAQRLLGARARKHYREFLELETATLKDVQAIQEAYLDRLTLHAVENIPFYRVRVQPRTGLRLADFPILTKEDIRNNFIDLMTSTARSEYNSRTGKRHYSWLLVQTGGSTGVPTTVIHGAEFRDRGRAARLYSHYLCGFPFGTPHFRLWGSMREINQMKESLVHRIQSYLSGEILLNAFRMHEKHMQLYIDTINISKVLYMMAYVDAAYALAQYVKVRRISVRQLDSIMACAGTLTTALRETLHSVFGARVHNLYGSRECGAMACECIAGGFHILSNRVAIEVVDEKGHPVPAGGSGRILVTLLNNWEFPLIRYEIGDIGSLSAKACSCGRPFPLLAQLEGRSVEFLQDTHGGYVSPVYIRHLIGVVHNPELIHQFQLVQHDLHHFELRVATDCSPNDPQYLSTLEAINRDLKSVFGPEVMVRVVMSRDLGTTDSGKFLYTVNKMGVQSS